MFSKKLITSVFALSFIFPACSAKKITSKQDLKTEEEKLSYAIGMQIGESLKRTGAKIDQNALAQAIEQVLKGSKPILTDDEAMQIQRDYFQKASKEKGEKSKKEGDDYLAKNKTKDGVKTTATGLQYKVIKEGTGAIPKATDKVKVHYKGTLIDGTEFDSSYKRNQPAEFPVNGVIPGWTEALQLMKVGSKYELVIPSNIAYGERGAGQLIGPNTTLLFEVELLEILK